MYFIISILRYIRIMKRSCIKLNRQDQKAEEYQTRKKKNKLEQEAIPKYFLEKQYSLIDSVRFKRLRNIRYLCLSNSHLNSVNFLKYFDNTLLKTLNLNNNCLLSLKGLQKCDFAQLQILYVRYNFLKEYDPFHLYIIPKIKQIYLNQNGITFIEIPKLRRICKQLRKVQVHGNPIIKILDKYNIIQK